MECTDFFQKSETNDLSADALHPLHAPRRRRRRAVLSETEANGVETG